MPKLTDYTKPVIMDQGYGFCSICKTHTYQLKMQGVWDGQYRGKRILVPTIYCICMDCLEEHTLYGRGEYDDILGVYMIYAILTKDGS